MTRLEHIHFDRSDPDGLRRRAATIAMAAAALAIAVGGCQAPPTAAPATAAPSMRDAVVARPAPRTEVPTVAQAVAGPQTVAATPAAGTAPLAMVNGRPIAFDVWFNLLKRAHGLSAFQQVLATELARQAAEAKGIVLDQRQLEAGVRHDIVEIVGPEVTDPDEQKRILDAILVRRGVSMEEFRLSAYRNAYMRAVVEPIVERSITEEALRGEFDRLYGPKVQIRHIQLPAGSDPMPALKALSNGMAFDEAARQYSQNIDTAPEGGLLPPFSRSDPAVPLALREAAFKIEPGQVVGPVRTEGWSHIITLEARQPGQPVEYDQVTEQVRRSLKDQLMRQEMQRQLQEMLQSATIQVFDAELGAELNNLRKGQP